MLHSNGGQADTSNPLVTRHEPPASVVGNFHATAESMSRILQRHGHSAIMGALAHAHGELEAGMDPKTLNLSIAQEQMAALSGCELMATFHGDSASSRMIGHMTAAAGPPTTFTKLPRNGKLFNARDIPSRNRLHRQTNNRLDPIPAPVGT